MERSMGALFLPVPPPAVPLTALPRPTILDRKDRAEKGASMDSTLEIDWEVAAFEALSTEKLYAILQARAEVFVVEQKCVYLDVDGLDRTCFHIIGWDKPDRLAAYLRLIPPGPASEMPALGRILTTAPYRGHGLGERLVATGIDQAKRKYPGRAIKISAQLYLEKFYRNFGFEKISEPYDEDGIRHLDMLLRA
jgi:ElaA protein